MPVVIIKYCAQQTQCAVVWERGRAKDGARKITRTSSSSPFVKGKLRVEWEIVSRCSRVVDLLQLIIDRVDDLIQIPTHRSLHVLRKESEEQRKDVHEGSRRSLGGLDDLNRGTSLSMR